MVGHAGHEGRSNWSLRRNHDMPRLGLVEPAQRCGRTLRSMRDHGRGQGLLGRSPRLLFLVSERHDYLHEFHMRKHTQCHTKNIPIGAGVRVTARNKRV